MPDSNDPTGPKKAPRKPRAKASPANQEIAILSDIHSNLQALEAVLAECNRRKITRFFCLGDVVGYGAFPAECLKIVQALKCPIVIGNHDFYVATGEVGEDTNHLARAGVEYSIANLTENARDWLGDLPDVVVLEPFTLVHASLPEPLEWDYIFDGDDALPSLEMQETPICFFGHTHSAILFCLQGDGSVEALGDLKFKLQRDGRFLINPGSVGQPRGGDPRAQFAVFDPAAFTVEFLKVPYDMETAARAILDAGLPPYLAERLLEGV